MTFTQLTARPKNFFMGWLLVFRLEEGLVDCATLCVESEVILTEALHKAKPGLLKRMFVCMRFTEKVYVEKH